MSLSRPFERNGIRYIPGPGGHDPETGRHGQWFRAVRPIEDGERELGMAFIAGANVARPDVVNVFAEVAGDGSVAGGNKL